MKRKQSAKLLGAALAALAAVALMAPLAQAETPAPGYTQFKGCPSPKSEASYISACIRSVITGGYVKMGNKEVPINKTIELSGGTDEFLNNFTASPAGGLQKVKLKVPGGVVGLTGLTWLVEFLGSEALTLYAVTEAAGQPKLNGLENITLPIRIHLENGALGSNCYVGSFSSPIVWHLTTGTSGKLTGVEPVTSFTEVPEILFAKGGKYVDNTWAAPGANGCVLTLFGFIPISINGLVNTASGLPAAAGTNEAVQNFEAEIAQANRVYP
jgi:hypothetical protein